MTTHRIIVVDDHPLFRDALRQALTTGLSGLTVCDAGSLDELAKAIADNPDLDLVLLDLTMPGVSGYSGLMFLRSQHPALPVVIVSASDQSATIRRCIEFGASGFIPKSLSIEQIRSAVQHVLDGGVWIPSSFDPSGETEPGTSDLVERMATLTPQQLRVLMMLGEGLLNKQIAYSLDVSEATVKAHVSAILQKLGVDSRTQAVIALNKINHDEAPELNPGLN